ncbi:substrate-binding periplasmic protein [Pseudoalteromonas sp. SSM20]|uniref:substrate-binding periplasmic protein n=1 Tax=Pseudoalteromonas sp. SSM20 TaxID=3139394 RepID=UPI003BA9123F
MKRIVLMLCSLVCFQLFADQNSLRYNSSGSSNWVPYYMQDKATPGILGELIPRILEQANIPGIEVKMPPKRTNQALIDGELDFDAVCAEWFPKQYVGPEFVLSKPLFTIKEYFVGLTDKSKTAHLDHHNIGTVLGYYYYDDNTFNRVDFRSERELILALKKARVSRILIGDLTASYWAKKYDVDLQFQKLHTQGLLRIRLNKQKQHLLPRLNAAIDALYEQGVISNIVDKYTRLYSKDELNLTND